MDASRKRTIRVAVILTITVLLASALVYTSFNSSTDASTAATLLRGKQKGEKVQLVGNLVPGSLVQRGGLLKFRVVDPKDRSAGSLPVIYRGSVPDTVHTRRSNVQILVTGRYRDGVFRGQKDSLTAKCPSKFKAQAEKT